MTQRKKKLDAAIILTLILAASAVIYNISSTDSSVAHHTEQIKLLEIKTNKYYEQNSLDHKDIQESLTKVIVDTSWIKKTLENRAYDYPDILEEDDHLFQFLEEFMHWARSSQKICKKCGEEKN